MIINMKRTQPAMEAKGQCVGRSSVIELTRGRW